ncbi:prephenate dehydratase [Caldanaerovirga acetigignens]|jgi:prephenate dehydratase|uniref:Prephenate dehydratase n=1 Tax=Caldanaerovirga acetigignens TaxID=447595 RepID=A0A1M7GSB9_9FIRM|nr:prephenate dehydratase [Caldanaerovirga acetigignens]SHM19193.1 prephenate dehydratase [Caldanaerovirga acetigignens]
MAIRIGYLGPAGTFTEEAMCLYTSGNEHYEKLEFSSIPEMIYSIGTKIDEAVVPFENSIEGSVNVTLDLLIHESMAMIKKELVLPVNQNLLAKKPFSLEEIEIVYSHPQALYQCRRFLHERLPKALWRETESTAEAARIVAKSEKPWAAVGHRRLGELYGLLIVAENIQDYKNNVTRFIILSHEDSLPTGFDRTSVVFATENKPGSLYRVLGFFARENLNLTKIESRPSRKALGEYVFLLEVEGHRDDEVLKKVLMEVQNNTTYFKILGSYPRWQEGYPPAGGDRKDPNL